MNQTVHLLREQALAEMELLPMWVRNVHYAGADALKPVIEHMALHGDVSADIAPKNTQKRTKIHENPMHENAVIVEVFTETKTVAIVTEKINKQVLVLIVSQSATQAASFFVSEAGILLDNMLKSIQLKRDAHLEVLFDEEQLTYYQAPYLLVFGGELPENMGKMQGVATHHPQHLLQNPQDKRAAWQALCAFSAMLKAE